MTLEFTLPAGLDRAGEIVTDEASAFPAALHKNFTARREELVGERVTARKNAASTGALDFFRETREVRERDRKVAPTPVALQDRRVEMTGPASPAKMAINALNSDAKVWLADLVIGEDHVDFLTPPAYDQLAGAK